MAYLSMSAMINEMRNTESDAARLLDLSLKSAPQGGGGGAKSKLNASPTKAGGEGSGSGDNASGGQDAGAAVSAFGQIMSMFG